MRKTTLRYFTIFQKEEKDKKGEEDQLSPELKQRDPPFAPPPPYPAAQQGIYPVLSDLTNEEPGIYVSTTSKESQESGIFKMPAVGFDPIPGEGEEGSEEEDVGQGWQLAEPSGSHQWPGPHASTLKHQNSVTVKKEQGPHFPWQAGKVLFKTTGVTTSEAVQIVTRDSDQENEEEDENEEDKKSVAEGESDKRTEEWVKDRQHDQKMQEDMLGMVQDLRKELQDMTDNIRKTPVRSVRGKSPGTGERKVRFEGEAVFGEEVFEGEDEGEQEPISRRTRSQSEGGTEGMRGRASMCPVRRNRTNRKEETPRQIIGRKEGGYYAGRFCDDLAGWSEGGGFYPPWPREGSFSPQCNKAAHEMIEDGYGDPQWDEEEIDYLEECLRVWDKYVISQRGPQRGLPKRSQHQGGHYPLRYKNPQHPPVYVPWGHTDKDNMKNKLPPLTEGAGKWIEQFECETAGTILAIGDVKSLFAALMGPGDTDALFGQAQVTGVTVANGNHDGVPFNNYRTAVWAALRDRYPDQPDIGALMTEFKRY